MNAGYDARGRARTRKKERMTAGRPLPENVVPLHQRILPRYRALLARWLEAGRPMGLCEASAFIRDRQGPVDGPHEDYVLIWVRENIDPAYMVLADGMSWLVVDAVRHQTLARTRTFAAALHFIRPVLPLEAAA